MKIPDLDSKNFCQIGLGMSSEPRKMGMHKLAHTEVPNSVEQASVMEIGAGDGITEMIQRIAVSITYDEVVDEMKSLFTEIDKLADVNNGSFARVIFSDQGVMCEKGTSMSTSKESVEQNCEGDQKPESKEIMRLLGELSKVKVAESCHELRESLLEKCEMIATDHSQKLWKELAQDKDTIRFKDYTELLRYFVYSYDKAIFEFGRGTVERLVVGFRNVVQKFADDLKVELASWYDEKLIKDYSNLCAEFEEEIKEFTAESYEVFTSLCDSRLEVYSDSLRNKILPDFKQVRNKFLTIEEQATAKTNTKLKEVERQRK